ncbi:MAG: hypothetical protein IJS28_07140 [Synergistaceae bacterium]|nr:hypothetical protein [Synergistaceae bacterium]
MSELERWYSIASEIEALISMVEAEIGAKNFSGTSSRHSLSKIDKKLYEALEIANKAAEALSED